MNANEQQTALQVFIDLLESKTDVRRTRKSGNSNPTQTDKFKYPNDDKSIWYEHEQFKAEHRFDCEGFGELSVAESLDLLVGALIDQLVIIDQRSSRALSAESFAKKYKDGEVEIDVRDACSKKSKQAVSVEKLTKQAEKLTVNQKRELAKNLFAELGVDSIEEFEAQQAESTS
jgi:hypothetical protein